MRAYRRTLVVALILTLVLSPAIAMGVAAQESTATQTQTPTATPTSTPTATPTPAANASATGPSGGPGVSVADQARVTAVQFDKDYLRVQRTETHTWRSIGPYVVFATSAPVEAARITQPKAQATVLDGSHTVRVQYDPDAAPPDGESLYTLELFFQDSSKLTLRLYATQTDQIVASAQLKQSSGFIETMKEDAEDHGYEPTIEGIQNYHEWEKEQADLFDNLFAPQFEAFLAWLIVTVQTPFAIIFGAAVIVLASYYLLRHHGDYLRSLQNGEDLVEQSRQQMELIYRQEIDAADEERLEDLDAIGPFHVYWDDAMNVNSVKQLADLFAFGRPVTDDHGNIVRYGPKDDVDPITDETGSVVTDDEGDPVYPPKMVHRGVADLRGAENLRETWLEPVLRPHMLRDEQTALAHAKRALARMTTHYGMPEYRPARRRVRSMLRSLSDGDTASYDLPVGGDTGTPTRPSSSGRASGAGGDD